MADGLPMLVAVLIDQDLNPTGGLLHAGIMDGLIAVVGE